MNKNELLEVLNNLYKSKENVILIDGNWGSGKTYLINEFMNNFRELPIYYVTMLGLKNVDEINTSLYLEINGQNTSIKEIIPSSINPLKVKYKNVSTSLDFILKKSNEAQAIIIFDDFERYSSSDYDQFLSYISNLVLNKAKIIVVSNLKELGGGEKLIFNDYKEKIFDHIYKADLFEKNIYEFKYNEYKDLLNSNSIKLLKSNIRLVDKSYVFLDSIFHKIDLNRFSKKFLKEFNELLIAFITIFYEQNKLNYFDNTIVRANNEVTSLYKKYFVDENEYYDVLHIYEYIINNYKYEYLKDIGNLILGLYFAYTYAKYDYLNEIMKNI